MRKKSHYFMMMLTGFMLLLLTGTQAITFAAPNSVTLAGSLQSELGCGGDWQADCAATHLTEVANDVWRSQFTVPAGDWEYKMVIDDSWDNGSHPASNKLLSLGAETAVTFYYDHKTNGVVDSVNNSVAVAAGSFQDQLGCAGAWQPSCVASLLTDPDGDGVYSFVATGLAPAYYEFKVALNEGWDTAYPAGNMSFTTTAVDDFVTITWNSATTEVTVEVAGEPQTAWVVAGNFQDDLPAAASCGEWNNTCGETTMEDDDGDGVFRLVGDDLPAGSYEFKVVEFGNWDNAHPSAMSASPPTAARCAGTSNPKPSASPTTPTNVSLLSPVTSKMNWADRNGHRGTCARCCGRKHPAAIGTH